MVDRQRKGYVAGGECVKSTVNTRYTYNTKEERDKHVTRMQSEGWAVSKQIKVDDHDGNWSWYAEFAKERNLPVKVEFASSDAP